MDTSKRYDEYIESEWYKNYMEKKANSKHKINPSLEYKQKEFKKRQYHKKTHYLWHKMNS